MMIRVLFFWTGFLLLSCGPMIHSQVPGKYESVVRDNTTTIDILEDGKFTFNQNNLGVIRTCSGSWELLPKARIVLKCDDQSDDTEYVLSSGYMEPLDEVLLIKGKRKIKLDNLILVRKNQ